MFEENKQKLKEYQKNYREAKKIITNTCKIYTFDIYRAILFFTMHLN